MLVGLAPGGWWAPCAACSTAASGDVGRLMVAPDLQGQGLGRPPARGVEAAAPAEATSYALFTGAGSRRNQKMYKKAGYRLAGSPRPASSRW